VVSELRIIELLVISIFPVAGLVFYSKYPDYLVLAVKAVAYTNGNQHCP
jgi:hypothetical protein